MRAESIQIRANCIMWECGLKDVYLINGFEVEEHDGEQHLFIHNVEDLHWAIGRHLATNHGKSLNGREVRFLRWTMNMTQAQLAAGFDKDAQTVARWEKDEITVPMAEAKLLKATFLAMAMSDEDASVVRAYLLSELGEQEFESCTARFQFSNDDSWGEATLKAVGGA